MPQHKKTIALTLKFILIALLALIINGCYTIKNKNDERRINLQIFKNKTTIYGLESELAQFLPNAFRKEAGFRTGNTNFGYVVRGQILDYKKKVIRKTTNGDPTHQQVTIEVLVEFLENDKVLNSQKITNTSYRLDSGLYNSTAGENESFGRQIALSDISEAIAHHISYYFLEN
jgi:hypothetical protein